MKRIRRGFTLIELLVVIAIIGILLAIILPVFSKVRRQAGQLLGASRLKAVVESVTLYAEDHEGYYPPSVATIGQNPNWGWQEPMVLTGYEKRAPSLHRALSEYLGRYIKNPEMMFCPNAPEEYPYIQEAWEAGDAWDNPDPETRVEDPVFGVYCFFWNYVGYLDEQRRFVGPRRMSETRRGIGRMLVSDYLGFNHWRADGKFASCEKLRDSSVSKGTAVSSDFWSQFPEGDGFTTAGEDLGISLKGGYVDGHVESYLPENTTAMRVSTQPDGSRPYRDDLKGPGIIFVPER